MRFYVIALLTYGITLGNGLVLPRTSSTTALSPREAAIREITAIFPRSKGTCPPIYIMKPKNQACSRALHGGKGKGEKGSCNNKKTGHTRKGHAAKHQGKHVAKTHKGHVAKTHRGHSAKNHAKHATKHHRRDSENQLEARTVYRVSMGQIKFIPWVDKDEAFSPGFAGCTAVLIYTQVGLVFAHLEPKDRSEFLQQIEAIKRKMSENHMGAMSHARAVIVHHEDMTLLDSTTMRDALKNAGVPLGSIKVEDYDANSSRKDKDLIISRKTSSWPPSLRFGHRIAKQLNMEYITGSSSEGEMSDMSSHTGSHHPNSHVGSSSPHSHSGSG